MRINLSVTAGPHTGKVFTFEEHDNFIVGRSKRAHFQLPVKDKYFSRIHFMVEVNPPYCRLMDMGSTNGTYVNGAKVDMADLKDGDQIKAGQTVLHVSVQGQEASEGSIPELVSSGAVQPLAKAPEPQPVIKAPEPPPVVKAPDPPPPPAKAPDPPPPPARTPEPVRPAATVPEPPRSPFRPPEPARSSIKAPEPVRTPIKAPDPPRPVPRVPEPPRPVPQPVYQSAAVPELLVSNQEAVRPVGLSGPPEILEVLPVSLPPQPMPPPASPPPNRCRVCMGGLSGLDATAVPTEPPLDPSLPICTLCWDLICRRPQPIEAFYIAKEIGHGAMGVVNLAIRKKDGLPVALKTIIPAVAGARSNVDRFFREANILKELDHPNIVAFRDMGESNGQLFFAMDYVRGRDAAKLLKENGGPMAITRAVSLVCQLLEALEYAHAKGFVHRDIKPANLLVEQLEGRETAKLADFGLARVYQTSQLSGLTMTGDLGGTVAFMAPEQITHYREAKPPVDQYAAGATLYNLLTDKFTYDLTRHVQQQILMVLQNDPVPILARRKDIPKPLAEIVHRSMAREMSQRYPDVKTMRKMLLKFTR